MQYLHVDFNIKACSVKTLGSTYLRCVRAAKEDGHADALKAAFDLNEFLDPTIPTELMSKDLRLCAQGVTYFQDNNGIWHVAFVVGLDTAPNAADTLMEDALKDRTTKIHPTSQMSLLTADSCLYVIHRRGYITNGSYLKKHRRPLIYEDCFLPQDDYRREMHLDPGSDEFCTALLWQAVMDTNETKNPKSRDATRTVGDIEYQCAKIPEPDKWQPEFKEAVIEIRKIGDIHIMVGDPTKNTVEENDKIQQTINMVGRFNPQLPVWLVDN